MMKRIDNQTVTGPGFRVVLPNIHWVRYEEGDRVAMVEVESGVGPGGTIYVCIYTRSLSGWEKPHHFDDFPWETRVRVFERICAAFDLLGTPNKLDPPLPKDAP
ncbi:MAG TPA: hypothetical protein VMV18_06085 [bacterium]|nr:hypothetical protein [bacterium]